MRSHRRKADDPVDRHLSGNCKACGASGTEPFYTVPGIPVNSCLLVADEATARNFPTGDLELGFCGSCGFIQNDRFRAELARYSPAYEESQAFSPRYMRLVDEILADQDRKHGLAGKTVLEIGCGKGDFLMRLVERTGATGVGIDPAYRPDRATSRDIGRLTFIQDTYGPAHSNIAADIVICRHTLEHIPDVAAFLALVRRNIANRSDVAVVFELPDTARILKQRAFWDLYYEHCSYFTAGSLARTFRRAGFVVLDVYRVYDGQYLILEARPACGAAGPSIPHAEEEDPAEIGAMVHDFKVSVARKLGQLRSQIDGWVAAGKRVVLWGSGSKATGYLATLGVGAEVLAVIDINPHKAGHHQAGTGHRIELPSSLPVLRPDVVLVMNPIYLAEIAQCLATMGLDPELQTLA